MIRPDLTISELVSRPCIKCVGLGFLSAFQHYKGGECFRCGASGNDPVMKEVIREATDDEVVAEMNAYGFDVIFNEPEANPEADWLEALFGSEEYQRERAEAMNGARVALRELIANRIKD